LFLERTEVGRAIRATSDNRFAAGLSGINVENMYFLAFGLGTAMTASAGAVIIMYFPATPDVGFHFILIMFLIVILGGLGSVKGALVAGLMIGVIEQLSTIWLPLEIQPSIMFVLFVLVILVKPEGLFGVGRRGAH
jgi:branched-chain amino acid transport system permease protein